MPKITTQAIVLRRADTGDNDRMLTLFTPDHGLISAMCRGCRKQKSPLMAASEVFCSGEYVLYRREDHATVVSCDVREAYYPLRQDVERLSHGAYLVELCALAVQPEEENRRLFVLLSQCLAYLAYDDVPSRNVTALFLLGFMSLMGFRPMVAHCAVCGRPLDDGTGWYGPERGGVLCRGCRENAPELQPSDIGFLHAAMGRGVAALREDIYCSREMFASLRSMAESHLEAPVRSGRTLIV